MRVLDVFAGHDSLVILWHTDIPDAYEEGNVKERSVLRGEGVIIQSVDDLSETSWIRVADGAIQLRLATGESLRSIQVTDVRGVSSMLDLYRPSLLGLPRGVYFVTAVTSKRELRVKIVK